MSNLELNVLIIQLLPICKDIFEILAICPKHKESFKMYYSYFKFPNSSLESDVLKDKSRRRIQK